MFDWLLEYKKLEESIAFITWNLNKTRLELIRWEEGDLKDLKLTRESKGANVEEAIERLEFELKEKEKLKESLLELINSFEGLDTKIIKMKYIDGMTLEAIAEETNYSAGYIRRKHTELKKAINFLDEWNNKKVYE